MDLYLRKVIHPQARDNYRVVLKDYIPEVEIGLIGIQHAAGGRTFWRWAIDTVVPMRGLEAQGTGTSRDACMKHFRAAWERFAADPARLTEFLEAKRKRLKPARSKDDPPLAALL